MRDLPPDAAASILAWMDEASVSPGSGEDVNPGVAAKLLPLVYDELRRLAVRPPG